MAAYIVTEKKGRRIEPRRSSYHICQIRIHLVGSGDQCNEKKRSDVIIMRACLNVTGFHFGMVKI